MNIKKTIEIIRNQTIGSHSYIMKKLKEKDSFYVELFQSGLNEDLTDLSLSFTVFLLLASDNVEKVKKDHVIKMFNHLKLNKTGNLLFEDKNENKTYSLMERLSDISKKVDLLDISVLEKNLIVEKIIKKDSLLTLSELSKTDWLENYELNYNAKEIIRLFSQRSVNYKNLFKIDKSRIIYDSLKKNVLKELESLKVLMTVEEVNNLSKVFPKLITEDFKSEYLNKAIKKLKSTIGKSEQKKVKAFKSFTNKVLVFLNTDWENALLSVKDSFHFNDLLEDQKTEVLTSDFGLSLNCSFYLEDMGIKSNKKIIMENLLTLDKNKSIFYRIFDLDKNESTLEELIEKITKGIYSDYIIKSFLSDRDHMRLLTEYSDFIGINNSGFYYDSSFKESVIRNLFLHSNENLEIDEYFFEILFLEFKR